MDETTINDQLYEVELRVANLIRRYQRLEERLRIIQRERDNLLEERDKLQELNDILQRKLSITAISSQGEADDPHSVEWLEGWLRGLLSQVDDCIGQLDIKLSSNIK